MMNITTIISFIGASVVLGLAPGPDNLFVLNQSIVKGRKAGIVVTLGLCTGLLVHSCAAALGLAALFQVYELAFSTLKSLGAVYLVYLAWKMFSSSNHSLNQEEKVSVNYFKLYRRGIIMNLLNPKVSIFFLAFLPQFINSKGNLFVYEMLFLGGLFTVCTFIVFSLLSLFSGWVGKKLQKSPKIQESINYLVATVFVILSIKLILG